MNDLASFRSSLGESRRRILEHPLYSALDRESRVRLFMQSHVFAVWDFMSLLKALQRRLTSVDLPWRPVGDPESRRLINEIVLAEESDETPDGSYASHFELYLRAMGQAGADLGPIQAFLRRIGDGESHARALDDPTIPAEARVFVASTFGILEGESLPAIAAALAYGREDLVPPMFSHLVEGLERRSPGSWSIFRFYLQRHVQLDGEAHGPMAGRLLERLCAGRPEAWDAAVEAALKSLAARRRFWDELERRIRNVD